MIMYFHVVSCLWLLGWFGDVLSCWGCMLLCIFVLESFSRCGRPRARFVELIRCSRPWACFGELKRRFPFSAAQVSGPVLGLFSTFSVQKINKNSTYFLFDFRFVRNSFWLPFGHPSWPKIGLGSLQDGSGDHVFSKMRIFTRTYVFQCFFIKIDPKMRPRSA